MAKTATFMATGVIKQMYGLMSGPSGMHAVTSKIERLWKDLESELQSGVTEENGRKVNRLAMAMEVALQELSHVPLIAVPFMQGLQTKAEEEVRRGPTGDEMKTSSLEMAWGYSIEKTSATKAITSASEFREEEKTLAAKFDKERKELDKEYEGKTGKLGQEHRDQWQEMIKSLGDSALKALDKETGLKWVLTQNRNFLWSFGAKEGPYNYELFMLEEGFATLFAHGHYKLVWDKVEDLAAAVNKAIVAWEPAPVKTASRPWKETPKGKFTPQSPSQFKGLANALRWAQTNNAPAFIAPTYTGLKIDRVEPAQAAHYRVDPDGTVTFREPIFE